MADENEQHEQPNEETPKEQAKEQAPAAQDAGESKPDVPKPPPKKPAAPPKPKGPQREPWSDALTEAVSQTLPETVRDAYTFLGQRNLVIERGQIRAVLEFLRRNPVEPFDFLSDETAVHWPKDEEFEVIYVLYSFQTHARLIVRTRTPEWEPVGSATPVWPGADWLEREIFDMFGIRFEGHPNLKRILLPEDWVGRPLRKDYDMRLQDVEWVKKHLGIESGQKFYVGKARHEES